MPFHRCALFLPILLAFKLGSLDAPADPLGPCSRQTSWVISEVMYLPAPRADGRSLEFIEIYNAGLIAEDLGRHRLTGDFDFSFPPNFLVPAGGFVVVAPVPSDIEAVYNLSGVLGGSTQHLSASGGSLRLVNPAGAVLLEVHYSPDLTSPAQTAGGGYSLVLHRPSYGEGDPRAWAASAHVGGSPGTYEPSDVDPSTVEPYTPWVGDVVINEIMYHPLTGDDADQYVELFNRGTLLISLAGWRFTAGIDFQFPEGVDIPAGGYVVVAKNTSRLLPKYLQLAASQTYGNFGGALAHSGERLTLARPTEVVSTNTTGEISTNTVYVPASQLTYGDGGQWGHWSDGGGSSLELIDPRSDIRLAANWADSDESAKAPWTTVEATGGLEQGVGAVDQLQLLAQGAGEYLVDDIEARGANTANLVANGSFDTGVARWTVGGTEGQSSWESGEGVNAPGCFRVIAVARGDTGANNIRTALASGLRSGSTGTLRAKVRWLRGHPEFLLRLRGNYLEAWAHLEIPPNLGTPGARNSRALENAAPAVWDLQHSPILPAANQAVVITARVADPDGVRAVRLKYRLDPATTLTEVEMRDDGSGEDAAPGDGVFTASIPGRPSGTLLAFQVTATDAASSPASATYPEVPALIRFGENRPAGSLGTYRLWMTQDTFNRWASRPKLDNAPLPVTFVYNDERVVHGVGALFAGSPHISPGYSTPSGNLCGYTLVFPKDEPFLGSTDVVLDWPGRDDTAQQEPMAYWLARELGIPFNHRRYVRLHVNGVTETSRGSIYEDAQQVNSSLIESWNPQDAGGQLFKIEQWFEFDNNLSATAVVPPRLEDYRSADGSKRLARYRWNWLPRSLQGSASDYQSLFELVDAANAPGPEDYDRELPARADLEEWMRIFATENIIVNLDAWGYDIGKNMYAYKPPSGKWQIYMWDIDWVMLASAQHGYSPQSPLMYRRTAPFGDANRDPVIGRMYDHPAIQRAYWRAIEDAVNGPLVPKRVAARMDATYAALVSNGVSRSSGSPLAAPDAVKTWLVQRRAYLQQQLDGISAAFILTPPPGSLSSTNVLTLSGSAPIRVRDLLVNGRAYPTTWTDVTHWSMRVPLQAGSNSLQIQGLDRSGASLVDAAASASVRYDGNDPDPSAVHVTINEWMAANRTASADPADGRFDDWFELYNPAGTPADLAGFAVTDDERNPKKFVLPAGTVLQPHGFLLIWADQEGSQNQPGGDLHANFKLNQDGEFIALVAPDGHWVDQVVFTNAAIDLSQGRWPDGGAVQEGSLQRPTPRAANSPPRPVDSGVRVLGLSMDATHRVTVTWAAESGVSYRLQAAENLVSDAWFNVAADIAATGSTASLTDPGPLATSQRFYRVVRLP